MTSLIDTLSKWLDDGENGEAYRGVTYSESAGNKLELLDTPRLWGQTIAEIDEQKHNRETGNYGTWLVKAVHETIAGAKDLVDITTLGPLPTTEFRDAMIAAVKELIGKKIVIRVLVSHYAQNAKVWFNELFTELRKAVDDDLSKVKLSLYVGYVRGSASSWNHAKIIAVDGKRAIVGGHNWWSDDYLAYPPVHDVSFRVTGPAAYDAHAFADHLWTFAKANMATTNDYAYSYHWTPGMEKPGIKGVHLGLPKQSPDRDGDGGRLLALGRLGAIGKGEAAQASNVAKLLAIENAEKLLCISQQDLLLPLPNLVTPHLVVDKLADALLRNDELEVRVVVSNKRGGSGTNAYVTGDLSKLCNVGYGATGTYRYVCERIDALAAKVAKARLMPEKAKALAKGARARLKVAPLRTSAKDTQSEDEYTWPGDFKVKCVGATKTMLAAPANHAKVYIVDDRAFYFGSDNLYPNLNQEFGYLVEDGALTKQFIKEYWTKLWNACKGACVSE